jgi:hypothetical protein
MIITVILNSSIIFFCPLVHCTNFPFYLLIWHQPSTRTTRKCNLKYLKTLFDPYWLLRHVTELSLQAIINQKQVICKFVCPQVHVYMLFLHCECVCVCVCVCACVRACACVCLRSVFLNVCLSVFYMYFCLYACLTFYPCVCLSAFCLVSLCLYVCQSVSLSVCQLSV